MDTKLLHDKIERFSDCLDQGKFNRTMAAEMLTDFSTWLEGIEKYMGEIEFDNIVLNDKIITLQVATEAYKKMVILTGNLGALLGAAVMEKDVLDEALDFLLENKDRVNLSNIYAIGVLLQLAKYDGRKVKTLVDLVNYGRTGEI